MIIIKQSNMQYFPLRILMQYSIIGVITDKTYLPITRLNFGRIQLETSSGIHTLGRFECGGQHSVSGMPTSCSDLWKIGNTLSGIYLVMGFDYVETVYCDFTKLSYEQGKIDIDM